MNPSKLERLQELIDEGYEFKFSDYIGKGFQLYKQNIGGFIGYLLVFWLIAMVCNFIPFIGTLAYSILLAPALTVGAYIVSHKIDKGEMTEFGDFFKGFDHIAQLAIAAVVTSLVYMLFAIPFLGTYWRILSGDTTAIMDFSFSPWMALMMAPIIYLAVSWSWTGMFIVFYDMKFWDAMEMSRKIISKNWVIIFLFMLVSGLIAASGAILLFVGIFLTVPLIICAQYAAFADVTKLLEDDRDDDIERHLVV